MTNMNRLRSTVACGAALFLSHTCFAWQAHGNATVNINVDKLEACQVIKDRLNRLACFDTLLGTPATITPPRAETNTTEPSVKVPQSDSVSYLINELEKTRAVNEPSSNWLVRQRQLGHQEFEAVEFEIGTLATDASLEPDVISEADEGGIDEPDVFLLVRELSPASNSKKMLPALLLTCEGNITTLRFYNRSELNSTQAWVSFRTEQGVVATTKMQTNRDNRVLLAGRGLESIEMIRSLLDQDRLVVDVAENAEESLTAFNIEGLAEAIRPLRQSCHW